MKFEIDNTNIVNKRFRFVRDDGGIIYHQCVLAADGKIIGATRPDESRWEFRGNTLVFMNAGGIVTTEFAELAADERGWRLKGRTGPAGPSDRRILEPVASPRSDGDEAGGRAPVNEVVIARYGENIDWIKLIPDEYTVTVYNKGQRLVSTVAMDRADRIVDVENIGREAETYLSHLVNYRQSRSGFLVFAQGNPFEHCPDFIPLLRSWRLWRPLQTLSVRFTAGTPPDPVLRDERCEFVGKCKVRPELFSLSSLQPVEFYDSGVHAIEQAGREYFGVAEGDNLVSRIFAACGMNDAAERAAAHLVGQFAYGAVFGALNSVLDTVPTRALDHLLRFSRSHRTAAWVMERLWLHLLGAEFFLRVPERAPAPRM